MNAGIVLSQLTGVLSALEVLEKEVAFFLARSFRVLGVEQSKNHLQQANLLFLDCDDHLFFIGVQFKFSFPVQIPNQTFYQIQQEVFFHQLLLGVGDKGVVASEASDSGEQLSSFAEVKQQGFLDDEVALLVEFFFELVVLNLEVVPVLNLLLVGLLNFGYLLFN